MHVCIILSQTICFSPFHILNSPYKMPVPIRIILIFSCIGIILNSCYELKITIMLVLRASSMCIINLSRLKFLAISENLFLMSLLAISGHLKLSH